MYVCTYVRMYVCTYVRMYVCTYVHTHFLCNNFKEKINLIHSVFIDQTPDTVSADSPQLNSQLASSEPATTAEVRKLVMSSPSKSCDLDPLPTTFPENVKCTHVNPVLKKTTLPKEELNNYRLISNISFISKILEKVVANLLRSHICINGLSSVSQSAYKQFHSTETAL